MMLDRSGIRANLGELLVIWLIAGLALILLAWVLAGVLGIFIVLILLFVVPPAALQGAVDHRAKLFASQLPDASEIDGEFIAGRLFAPPGPGGRDQAVA